jgi:hypothetical protein
VLLPGEPLEEEPLEGEPLGEGPKPYLAVIDLMFRNLALGSEDPTDALVEEVVKPTVV